MNEDKDLQELVMSELEWEPGIDTAHIGVTAEKGVVTLTGHVASYAQKRLAEETASRVSGVEAVADEIAVRLPSDKKHADDEIAERAVKILAWDALVLPNKIKVAVQHGVVTLSGDVDWQYQRAAAEHDVHKLGGVIGIINRIAVRPRISASDVHTKIERALHRNADLDASGITVEAKGSKIVLGGRVRARSERVLAERAAWSAPGVTQVENHIRIG